ncbi:MAG: hypothetical protein SVU32_02555, partial [Candidatus Nanohaloarchaea archaeon]|nr:hypothetical protein [Candidatus Nanohaloarchaea archaeon]
MFPDNPDAALIHFSDMHFEDEDVFGEQYDSLDSYREHAYDQLEELADDVEYAWFSGDIGTEEDRKELEDFLEGFKDTVVVPGISDTFDTGYLEYDCVDDPERL